MRSNELTTNDRQNGQSGGFRCSHHAGPLASIKSGRDRIRHGITATLTSLVLGAALLGSLPMSARADTTQLPGGEYPDAQCTSPMRPFAGDKAWEWDMYRQKMGAYRACVDAYVRRARADIEHIQGKIDKAVREYNREVTMP
uniref:Uncharacterized protein n=1 Tax=Nitratidesulfovibrio vulgaris (strain DSM 19637 / Miyazaki F) TaxID=883 RepID=B8DJM0_NITV9